MLLQLTTSVNVGAIDPNSPYQQAKIVQIDCDPVSSRIGLVVVLGNTVDGNWVKGFCIEGKTVLRFTIDGSDYTTLVALTSQDSGEVHFDKLLTAMYQWLLDEGLLVGTIA